MNATNENFTIKGITSAKITPSDSNTVDKRYNHGLRVETAGDVNIETIDGHTHVWTFANDDDMLAIQYSKILSTNTTADNIFGLKIYR